MNNLPGNAAFDPSAPFNQVDVQIDCYDCEQGFNETTFGKVKSPCQTCEGTGEITVDESEV